MMKQAEETTRNYAHKASMQRKMPAHQRCVINLRPKQLTFWSRLPLDLACKKTLLCPKGGPYPGQIILTRHFNASLDLAMLPPSPCFNVGAYGAKLFVSRSPRMRWESILANIETGGRGEALTWRVKIICPRYGPPLGKAMFFYKQGPNEVCFKMLVAGAAD